MHPEIFSIRALRDALWYNPHFTRVILYVITNTRVYIRASPICGEEAFSPFPRVPAHFFDKISCRIETLEALSFCKSTNCGSLIGHKSTNRWHSYRLKTRGFGLALRTVSGTDDMRYDIYLLLLHV